MAIFEHRVDESGIGRKIRSDRAVGWIEKKGAFLAIPAVVLASFDKVNFFDVVLADIAGDQTPGRHVEGKAERITQPVGVDLVQGSAAVNERIGRGNAVAAVGADGIGASGGKGRIERIDAQNFTKHSGEVLAIADRGIVTVADIISSTTVA